MSRTLTGQDILDSVTHSAPFAALLSVFENSDCPHVIALRMALTAHRAAADDLPPEPLPATVFERHREAIDDLTDAADRLARGLDAEILHADAQVATVLRHWHDDVAAIGARLDLCDPDLPPTHREPAAHCCAH